MTDYEESKTARLVRGLGELETPQDSPSESAVRQRRVVLRLEHLIVEGATRTALIRRWRVWAAVALAAAVLLSVWGGWLARDGVRATDLAAAPPASVHAIDGAVQVVRAGQASELSLRDADSLRMLDVIQTGAESEAVLSTARGANVHVGSASRLRLAAPAPDEPPYAERLELLVGHVDVEVAEGGPTRSLSVVTPDAVVVVHGTRFTVDVVASGEGRAPETSVRVSRGEVAIGTAKGQTMLRAGGFWTSRTTGELAHPDSLPRPADARPADTAAPAAADGGSATASASRTTAAATEPTSLAAENRLYQTAMRAKLQGRDTTVVRQLDTFLARFPTSPLAPDARVERFRALQRLGRSGEAARSARRYLAEHPDGFAREEARDIALDSEPRPAEKKK